MLLIRKIVLPIVLGASLVLGACTPAIVGGVERSTGRAIDDFSIQTRLSRNLHRSSDDDYKNIDLEVVEARVLMTGRVASEEVRLEATRVAWGTNGVDEVINELEVSDRGVGIIRPGDTWITNRLRGRLVGDSGVRQANYHIETLHGTVYLFGIAQSQEELERAAGHARTLRGVDRVVTHVRIKQQRPSLDQGA